MTNKEGEQCWCLSVVCMMDYVGLMSRPPPGRGRSCSLWNELCRGQGRLLEVETRVQQEVPFLRGRGSS